MKNTKNSKSNIGHKKNILKVPECHNDENILKFFYEFSERQKTWKIPKIL